jgi:formate hydrogenlyase subunit 6/NADH:ubiquinone oxidoreductase subunit I
MKPGTMLRDVLRSSARRPVTELYPLEKHPPVAAFRGLVHYDPEACTGCGLCAKDCPANAIELITIDKAGKRFVMRYHVDRCTFCGQCAYSCRFDCINLSNDEWELARTRPDAFTITYGRPDDIRRLEATPEPDPATEAEPAG